MDVGRNQVDAKLAKLERKIEAEYSKALKDMQEKFEKHYASFVEKDGVKREKLAKNLITQEEYDKWYKNQLLGNARLNAIIDSLSDDLVHVDQIAIDILNGYIPEIFADSFNYETFAIEQMALVDTGFTLYNKDAVAFLVSKEPKMLPKAKLDIPKDKRWHMDKLRSVITQGILQGESIPKIAKRLREVTDMGKVASIRGARTMTTYAEAQGRMEAMQRARGYGIVLMKEWQATLDGRTRHSHRLLDGERRELNEPFSNGLMEPADPDGAPEEVYNCRCGVVAWFKEIDESAKAVQFEREKALGDMTYEQWKKARR